MKRLIVVVLAVAVCVTPLWAADKYASAKDAVQKAFPKASSAVHGKLARLLVALSDGEVLAVGYQNATAVFAVRGDLVTVRAGKRLGAPQLPVEARRPDTPVGPEPWLRPGADAGQEIIGPDGGALVWVPAGEFEMGSEGGDSDEKPVHHVKMTRGFWLGKCEVTNEQYAKFLQELGDDRDTEKHLLIDMRDSSCGIEIREGPPAAKQGREKHPVVEVTWYGAKAYCEHYGLALPTEAQWEWAARGDKGFKYPWGNWWDAKKCCNSENTGDGSPATMEVGSLPAGNSWCGACDMAGNVWEWCADWCDAAYYASSPEEDPAGPETGTLRLLRGGSWHNAQDCCGSADRCGDLPGNAGFDLGFRVARTP